MEQKRIAGVILLALAAATPCLAQAVTTPAGMSSRFIGTWKENESRRKLSSTPVLQFQTNAEGVLEELRGGPTPFAQAVHLNGVPYQVAPEDTVTWKQAGPAHFERQSVLRGQLASIRRITISNGGNTLTEETERHLPGRVSLITGVYARTSGSGAGLVGSWTLKSLKSDKPEQIVLSGVAMNTLLYTNSTTGMTYTATLDNRPVPVTGPGVAPGSTVALLRQLDDYTIVSTLSRNGVVTGNGLITVSPDGKVMTTTTTNVGRGASSPSIRVWEKQ